MINKDELAINDYVNVPKLAGQSNDGNYQISEIFNDGLTVKGYDEKIPYTDICPIEFSGRDMIFNGFEETWDFGSVMYDGETSYGWVKEIVPSISRL